MSRKRKKQIFENTTQLIGMFENLKFDTFYQVLCILFIDQLEIPSDWKTVETDCDRKSDISLLIHIIFAIYLNIKFRVFIRQNSSFI